MKTRYIIGIAAGALMLCGCQRESLSDAFGIQSDAIVKFVPSVTNGAGKQVKGELYNESGSDKSLGAYVNSFMVVAWNTPEGSDPAKVIPDETALAFGTDFITNGYQKVKKRTGAGGTEYWMTVQPQLYTEVAGAPEQADDEYIWKSGETKTFFAYANLPSSGASVTYADAPGQTLSYTEVPDDAAAQTDILLGFYKGDGKTGTGESAKMTGTASIKFHHPLTAVKFVRGTMDDEYVISSISLEGVAESGTATMDLVVREAPKDDTVSISWTDIASYEHTVSQSKSEGLSVAESAPLLIGEPFIIIPQNVGTNHVTVTVTLTNGMSASTTIESGIWQMGCTNTYTINFGGSPETGYSLSITEWDENAAGDIELDSKDYLYEFKVADNYIVFSNTTDAQTKTFQIESYRHEKGDDIIANREPVAYSAEYSLDGGQTWQSFDASATTATGLSGLLATGNIGYIRPTSVPLAAAAKTSSGTYSAARWTSDQIEASNWDLSRMQIGGEGDGTGVRNTANCYIVKHPGAYILPCVYGNSIQNGVETDKGYKTSVTGTYVLSNFINAAGANISNAWVLKDIIPSHPAAALLWTDAKVGDELLIDNVKLVNASGADFNATVDGYDDAYIRFSTADKANMVQGNAVVVLYDDTNTNGAYDEGEALWSWHLWVTDADLSSENTGVVSESVKFMCRNIGYCDGSEGTSYVSTAPDVQIRLTQEASATQQIVTVYQPDVCESTSLGNSLYYEWGRKDAFVGYSSGNKTRYVSTTQTLSSFDFSSSLGSGTTLLTNWIKNPAVYSGTVDNNYYNLWSVNMNTTASYAETAGKTVYDPSPYGYKIPNGQACKDLGTKQDYKPSSDVIGCMFQSDQNLVWPLSSYRERENGLINTSNFVYAYSCTASANTNQRDYHFRASDKTVIDNYKTLGYPARPILEQ